MFTMEQTCIAVWNGSNDGGGMRNDVTGYMFLPVTVLAVLGNMYGNV